MNAPEHKIYLEPDEMDQAVKDWLLIELKQGASKIYNLFIHLFTVSTGAIPILIGLYGFFHNDQSRFGLSFYFLIASLLIFTCAAVRALFLAFPKEHEVDCDTELRSEYNQRLKKAKVKLEQWFKWWLFGLILGAASLFIPC